MFTYILRLNVVVFINGNAIDDGSLLQSLTNSYLIINETGTEKSVPKDQFLDFLQVLLVVDLDGWSYQSREFVHLPADHR